MESKGISDNLLNPSPTLLPKNTDIVIPDCFALDSKPKQCGLPVNNDKLTALKIIIREKHTALGICVDGYEWSLIYEILITNAPYICLLSINPYTIPDWKPEHAMIIADLAKQHNFQVFCDLNSAYRPEILDTVLRSPLVGVLNNFVDWITVIPDTYIDVYNYYNTIRKSGTAGTGVTGSSGMGLELSVTDTVNKIPQLIISNHLRREITFNELYNGLEKVGGMRGYAHHIINITPVTVINNLTFYNTVNRTFKKQVFGIATNCIIESVSNGISTEEPTPKAINIWACSINTAMKIDGNSVVIVNYKPGHQLELIAQVTYKNYLELLDTVCTVGMEL